MIKRQGTGAEAGSLEVGMSQGHLLVCVHGGGWGQTWLFLGHPWAPGPEQEPTWLGAGWAWEEALGVKKTKMKVTQLQKHL